MRAPALLAILLAGTALALPTKTLPSMTYKFVSFAVAEPNISAQFFSRYTNSQQIQRHEFLTTYSASATVAGVRLYFNNGTDFSDVYFVNEAAKTSGNMTVKEFNTVLEQTHSMAPDDWNWWQDWHICFQVSDLDAVATKLLKENVPFVNRGGLYFQIPGGLTIQVLGKASIYWSETFYFCRDTNELTAQMKPYFTNVTDIAALPDKPLPEFVPSHQSYVSSNAVSAAVWAKTHLSVDPIDPKSYYISHQYANGTCAMIQWLELEKGGWEFHFIEQYHKRQGDLKVSQFEGFVKELHASNLNGEGFNDAYDPFRTGFAVSNVASFAAALADTDELFHYDVTKGRLVMMAPNGFLIELNQSP